MQVFTALQFHFTTKPDANLPLLDDNMFTYFISFYTLRSPQDEKS